MTEMINYTKGKNEEKNWMIEETSFDERYTAKCEAIFTQGNGYLGLRNALEERYVGEIRNMFVAGTFNKASRDEVTELPNVPDVVNMEITIDGERFAMNCGEILDYSRTLNLRTGETVRSLVWKSPKENRIKLTFHRFVSCDNVHIIGGYVEITPLEKAAKIRVLSGIDAQVTNSGAQHFTEGAKRAFEETYLEFPVVTTESGVHVLVHTAHRVISGGGAHLVDGMRIVDARRKIHCCYDFAADVGQTVRFEKISTVSSTRDLEFANLEPEEAREALLADSLSLVKEALHEGYDSLFAKSRSAWEQLWAEQDIRIESDNDFDQLAIRFALYHLQIMVRKGDGRIGIGAKGLSGEGYKGHSFWDTETFIFPYFQMAEPEVARTLLEYRYHGLCGARKKAAEQGYEGAMYPWESAWVSDGEVTPYTVGVNVHTGETMYCLTGLIEIHITADIIYSLWQYYIASGDDAFMDCFGYEMIIETARFWNSRLEWVVQNDRYEIRDVIGPDEYKEHVDNNAYTNYLVKYNMDLAAAVIEKLRTEKREVWEKLSKLADLDTLKKELEEKLPKLFLPAADEKTKIIPQFDGYFDLKEIDLTSYKAAPVVGTLFNDYSMEDIQGYQAGKQADIVELLYQLEDLVDAETKRSNYLYYEARTLHDSSLSKAIHSVTACDLGMDEEAYDMFQKAASTDLGTEMTSSDQGIHSANMGGTWQDVVMGFGGVRISQNRLRICPHLPKGWKSLTYPIYWRGSRLTVTVGEGSVEIENEGSAFDAVVLWKGVTIGAGKNVFQ